MLSVVFLYVKQNVIEVTYYDRGHEMRRECTHHPLLGLCAKPAGP